MNIVSKRIVVDTGKNWRILSNDKKNYFFTVGPHSKNGQVSGSFWGAVAPILIFAAFMIVLIVAPGGMEIDPVAGLSMAAVFLVISLSYTTGLAEYLVYRKEGGLPGIDEAVDVTGVYSLFPEEFPDKINELIDNGGSVMDVITFAFWADEDGLMSDKAITVLTTVESGGHVYDLSDEYLERPEND